jgi:protein-S-isoprenylcysteine O-methyltransferase Ste14
VSRWRQRAAADTAAPLALLQPVPAVSVALVVLQFALAAVLLATCWPPAAGATTTAAGILLAAGTAVGIAALSVNRPGNFNIRPEVKDSARLATSGVYRWVRHPMYTAVLLALLAAVLLDPRPWRFAVWLALAAVLLAKARREERFLAQRFEHYASYRDRTWRLLPWLW